MRQIILIATYFISNWCFSQLIDPIEPYVFQLENGFTVIVLPNNDVNNLTAELYFRAGGRYEKEGQHGFAHLMEHSLRPVRIFSNESNWPEYAKVFVRSNAQTRNDYTRYHQQIKSNGLEQVLAALSDRVNMPIDSLDKKRIDKNIKTVVSEISSPNNEIWYYDEFIRKTIKQNVYGKGHPYAHIQEIADIKNALPTDMQNWHRIFHNANQAFLLLSGNIGTTELKPEVEEYFGSLNFKNDLAYSKKEVPTIQASKTDIIQFKGKNAAIVMYWSIPEWGSLDGEVLRFLHGYLNQKINNRIKDVNLEGKFYGTVRLYELAGQLSLGVEFNDYSNWKIYETLLDDMLNTIALDDLENYKEDFFLKEQLKLEAYGFSSHKNRMVAEGAIFQGNPNLYFENLAKINTLEKGQYLYILKSWLLNRNSYTLVIDNRAFALTNTKIDHKIMPNVVESHNIIFPEVTSNFKNKKPDIHFINSKTETPKIVLTFNPILSIKRPEELEVFHNALKEHLIQPNSINYEIRNGLPFIEINFTWKDIDKIVLAIRNTLHKVKNSTNNTSNSILKYQGINALTVANTKTEDLSNQLHSISLVGNFEENEKQRITKNLQNIGLHHESPLVSIVNEKLNVINLNASNDKITDLEGYLLFNSDVPLNRLHILLLEELLSVKLNKLMRTDLRWTYYVEVEAVFLDEDSFAIKITSDLDNISKSKVEAFIDDELAMGKLEFSTDEFNDAKTYLKGGFIRMLDTKSGQSQLIDLLPEKSQLNLLFNHIEVVAFDDIDKILKTSKSYKF